MDEDDQILQRFLSKRPFEDGTGIRGVQPQGPPLRQIEGAVGGDGSYGVSLDQADGSDPVTPSATNPGESPATLQPVIIAFNGTLYDCRISGSVIGPTA